MSLLAKAADACAEYEHWAATVTRLTFEISECVCPHQSDPEPESHWSGGPSCFATKASEEEPLYEDEYGPSLGVRKPSLDEIEEAVKDCYACTELCRLIRARKDARKQYGIAKRRVRAVGKRIIKSQDPHDAHPCPELSDDG